MTVPSDYVSVHRTERLILQPLTREHIAPWIGFLSNPVSVRYFPERGINPEESAKVWINSQLLRYKDNRFGLLALHLEDGTFGQCGLITLELEDETVLEIGYHLFQQHCGKGYASEAANWFREYAAKHRLAEKVVSIIHTENALSQAVAERNGMQPWKRCAWSENRLSFTA